MGSNVFKIPIISVQNSQYAMFTFRNRMSSGYKRVLFDNIKSVRLWIFEGSLTRYVVPPRGREGTLDLLLYCLIHMESYGQCATRRGGGSQK